MAIILSTEQEDAQEICCDITNRIACVTGQAGTGKTTILRNVNDALLENYAPDQIVLAAPTGRAAKRIEEATGIDAMTIHRMLRYTTPKDDDDITLPQHDKFNPVPYLVILIDEASMIDEILWRGLIDAMPRNAIIRFFGDINQLPPIMSKSPFARAMQRFPTKILTHNYRSEDGIIAVSDKIIKGRIPIANKQVTISRIKSTETMDFIKKICDQHDFTTMTSQIISPTQRTKYGCDTINRFLQQRYNPEREKITTFQKDFDGNTIVRSFKRGDKVLWTKNDYTLNLMNGTIGIIQSFDKEEGSILCTFDGVDILIPPIIEGYNPTTKQTYRYDPRTHLMLGYAVTTHKAQGSQFDNVLYVITNSRAATRQNLYTALTRAKFSITILNVGGALVKALHTKVAV